MDISLTEDQTMIAETVREILVDTWPREVMRSYTDTAPHGEDGALWKILADSDFHTMLVPEAYGGTGAAIADVMPVLEELGYRLAPTRFATSAVVAIDILRSCQESPTITRLLDGSAKLTVILLDDVQLTSAEGVVSATGTARFVSDLVGASHAVLVTPDLVGVIDLDPPPPGVVIEAADIVDATRRLGHARIDTVPVTPLTPVGSPPELLGAARRLRMFTTVCDSLGGAQRALDMAVAYAKERHQFGRPIGSFQALQHLLADAYVAVENLRSVTWYAAHALDHRADDVDFAVLAASVLASKTYLQVADLNIQVHGGMGFTREVDAYLYAARAKINELVDGSAAERMRRISAWLQTSPLEELVDYLGGQPGQIRASMFAAAS